MSLWLFIGLPAFASVAVVAYSLCRAAAPHSIEERRLDDDGQREALAAYVARQHARTRKDRKAIAQAQDVLGKVVRR